MRINFVLYQVNEISVEAGVHPLCRELLKKYSLAHMAGELLLECDYNQTANSAFLLLLHSGCIQLFDHGPLGLLHYLYTTKISSILLSVKQRVVHVMLGTGIKSVNAFVLV